MFDMTTYELLKTLYIALTGTCISAGAIIVWFFIQGEKIHREEELGI